jgi:hypothetical protein
MQRALTGAAICALLLAAGCGSGKGMFGVAVETAEYVRGSGTHYPRTRDEIAAFPYAQLGFKLERRPPALLVLTELGEHHQVWSSSDRAALVISHGRLIKLSGAPVEFEVREVSGPDPLAQVLLGEPLALPAAHVRRVWARHRDGGGEHELYCRLALEGDETIEIVDVRFDTRRYRERCATAGGEWAADNLYWISHASPYVWQSIQHPAPGIGAVRYDVLKRPG